MPVIEAVDFFYLAMPEILDIGDGSQDALLVRISAGGATGGGECEASPLVTIASLVCPMSHMACKPVITSVIGEKIESQQDIHRIHAQVRRNSMDLLQADHTLSGIDMALWDLLGKMRSEPVYRLLGDERAYPKLPYASILFEDTPEQTLARGREIRQNGFQAVKFSWGPFGQRGIQADLDQLTAARESIGPDSILLVDAGTVWGDDVEAASARIERMAECRVTWLEEPFHTSALAAYRSLADRSGPVKLAGGEGSHNEFMAQQMIDYAGVGYIQIDTGRVGGITSARRVAEYARAGGVTYVNHTFTSHLALSASMQPFAGFEDHRLCEYATDQKNLACEITQRHLLPDANGEIRLPEQPGLGMDLDLEAVRKYLVDAEIKVGGKTLYRTPSF